SNGIWFWIDDFFNTNSFSSNDSCANPHFSMCQCWTIFYDEYAFIFYQFRFIYCDSRLRFNNRAIWFCLFDIVFYDLDRLFVCAINFIDDGYICCSETYFHWIVLQLMTMTMWIKHCNCKVWFIKGIIIIATIP